MLAKLSDNGQLWPKLVKTKFVSPVKLNTLAGLLQLANVLCTRFLIYLITLSTFSFSQLQVKIFKHGINGNACKYPKGRDNLTDLDTDGR